MAQADIHTASHPHVTSGALSLYLHRSAAPSACVANR